jgi:hypothetical protein
MRGAAATKSKDSRKGFDRELSRTSQRARVVISTEGRNLSQISDPSHSLGMTDLGSSLCVLGVSAR